jgi:hypothetical protein
MRGVHPDASYPPLASNIARYIQVKNKPRRLRQSIYLRLVALQSVGDCRPLPNVAEAAHRRLRGRLVSGLPGIPVSHLRYKDRKTYPAPQPGDRSICQSVWNHFETHIEEGFNSVGYFIAEQVRDSLTRRAFSQHTYFYPHGQLHESRTSSFDPPS